MDCKNCDIFAPETNCLDSCYGSKCAECGLEGNFAGYHHLGKNKKSLCMACAEQDIEVYKISEADPGNHFFVKDLGEALENIKAVKYCEDGNGYTIVKESMTLARYESLEEFQGF